jgi:hypothetical protein
MTISTAEKLRALEAELGNAYDRIDDLEDHIKSGAGLLDADDLEAIVEADDDSEIEADDDSEIEADDDSDDGRALRRNGIFADGLKYGARRVGERKARKLSEKAAIAGMRAAEARKKI